MISLTTKEWEITKNFIFDVMNKDGRINFDWMDFEGFARECTPSVMVKVDEALSIRHQSVIAVDEVKKNVHGTLKGLLVAVFYKEDETIAMDELKGLQEVLSDLPAELDVTWGVLQSEDLKNSRGVAMFAFEK